jgi:putative protease
MNQIELLAPAKDFEAARAAVLCGADAVYLGGPQFGARQAAGNTVEDVRQVVELAHAYYVKVYVALNTLLTDAELPAAEKLIHELYTARIDGLIIQDAGLLELDLPPLTLIASTQMNNTSVEKIKFLEAVGFSRAILARELTLSQIRSICKETSMELECFIHGALCVGQSGQCYLSYALGGRSGNRGRCAQPCRKRYTVFDLHGSEVLKDKYALSLKDLNLSDPLESLIDAGVTSFKIEGRLKDAAYVANIVGFYRRRLDTLLEKKGLRKSSSGRVQLNFEPDLCKSFNRGFTDYGIHGAAENSGSIDTPKSIGEPVGTVKNVGRDAFVLDGAVQLHSGDGICFFDDGGELAGTTVNQATGQTIHPQKIEHLRPGIKVWRNYDHTFSKQLQKPGERKIAIVITLSETSDGVALTARDEDGNEAVFEMTVDKQPAQKPDQARQTTVTQLQKLGNTIFECGDVRVAAQEVYFFPVSVLNTLKRGAAEKLLTVRLANTPRPSGGVKKNSEPYPTKTLTFTGNVLNEKAKAFYHRHGVEQIEPAAESGRDLHEECVMTTKYCLRKQLGLCPVNSGQADAAEPLLLEDEEGRLLRAEFRCGRCGMEIYLIK